MEIIVFFEFTMVRRLIFYFVYGGRGTQEGVNAGEGGVNSSHCLARLARQ